MRSGYAHRHGVVHRDIKPENILLQDGHAIVADFGIARAIDRDGQPIGWATRRVGTPAYMSPEQATPGSAIDGRTDIYSLGCVLYEMLAGHPPFTGQSTQEILTRHAYDPVPPLPPGSGPKTPRSIGPSCVHWQSNRRNGLRRRPSSALHSP